MRKTLRVGFVSIMDASSEKTWSGTPHNILRRLQEIPNMEVVLLSPLDTRVKWHYLFSKLLSKLTGKQFIWYLEPKSLSAFAAQIEAFAKAREIDVIFSPSSIPITYVRPEYPTVFWTDAVWEGIVDYYPGLFSTLSERTRAAGAAQEHSAIQTARFSCFSSEWAAAFARQHTSPSKIKVLPFGPNLPITHNSSDVRGWIANRLISQASVLKLLFVGKNWQRKGGNLVVQAAAELNDLGIKTELYVVGCTPAEILPDFVKVMGFLDKSEPSSLERLREIYIKSDIFILPSRAEAFGIVAAESAAFGLPAILSTTGGLPECIIDGRSGFSVPPDVTISELVAKIRIILDNYKNFSLAAYQYAEGRLNWNSSISTLAELLNEAASDNSIPN